LAGRAAALLLVLVLASFVLSSTAHADEVKKVAPATPAQKEYLKGQVALAANKLAEAQACFERSLQLDPKLVGPLLSLSEVEILKKNPAAADEYLRKAIALAPKDASVWTVRGHYLFFRKNYSEAEQDFKTAIRLDPTLERPYYELGDLYLLGFKKPDQAIAAYKSALALKPYDSRVRYTLGNALAEAGRLDEAQMQLEEAARFDPKNPSLQNAIGDFNLKRRKWDLAEQAYAKALAIDPHFIPARVGEGDVFVARRNFSQALVSYQTALQMAPKSPLTLVKVGALQELQGNWIEAERAYRNALAIDPNLVIAANNLAWILNEHLNKTPEAFRWATAAAALAPEDSNVQDTLGWVLRSSGDRTRALAVLSQAHALAPDNPQVLYHLGVVYQESQQTERAIQSLSRALSLSKNFEGAADAKVRLDALRSAS
jgi:tetratricopeptide (TPR) repeat protein